MDRAFNNAETCRAEGEPLRRLGWGAWRPAPTDKGNNFCTAAKPYVEAGIPVVPLHAIAATGGCTCHRGTACGNSAGKHPRTVHGINDATVDLGVISEWGEQWPEANVGLLTGSESDLIVLDVDPRNGGSETLYCLECQHGRLPVTPTAVTGSGGLHYYFRHPGGYVKSVSNALGAGLDVKGEKGQVVAPPSRNANGFYSWAPHRGFGSVPPADVPAWVLTLLNRPQASKSGVSPPGRIDTATALAGLPEGQRDSGLWQLACRFRRADLPQDLAEDLIEEAAAKCKPPYPTNMAVEKVRRAYKQFAPGGKKAPNGGTSGVNTVPAQEAAKWLK